MEQEKQSLVRSNVKLPGIVENAYDSIEKMNQFADILLDSKLVPDHFYEKGVDKKPDYSKGKRSSVAVVLIHAQQLNLPPMTALQHIIPVNGRLSINGELAKTMIFSSGKLKPGSWKEEETGSLEKGDYVVSITAARSDNGATLTRSFGISDAKRAGLWIDEAKTIGQDGWKWKQSAWWKFPKRMCGWRALGFLAKDLFSDVLMNTITTEEAMDIPHEDVTNIDLPNGQKITIPDKEFNAERSRQLTQKAAEEIKNNSDKEQRVDQESGVLAGASEQGYDITATPPADTIKYEEHLNEPQEKKYVINNYTMDDLREMDAPALSGILDQYQLLKEAKEILPKNNTVKKMLRIVELFDQGELAKVIDEHKDKQAQDKPVNEGMKGISKEELNFQEETPVNNNDIAPSDFDNETSKNVSGGNNKFGISFPDVSERSIKDGTGFKKKKELYDKMFNEASLDARKYSIMLDKLPELQKYRNLEEFCGNATNEEVNLLLNSLD